MVYYSAKKFDLFQNKAHEKGKKQPTFIFIETKQSGNKQCITCMKLIVNSNECVYITYKDEVVSFELEEHLNLKEPPCGAVTV